jgi:hypothetical protein
MLSILNVPIFCLVKTIWSSLSSGTHSMATNNCANENVVDNLLQTDTYNNLQTTCSNDMSKKVGLVRPLPLGVDSKIQAQILHVVDVAVHVLLVFWYTTILL